MIQWNTSCIDAGLQIPVLGAAVTDPQTGLTTRPVLSFVPGFHINTVPAVLAACPGAAAYRVSPEPNTLWRVWSGDSPTDPQFTIALKFADEAEARGVLAGWWSEAAA